LNAWSVVVNEAKAALRFVFDQHVNARALRQLRAHGVDAIHVAEVGLSEADDPEIFAWAVEARRIIVTRNYQDFAPLVSAYGKRGLSFPGVLFFATSVKQADAGHHVRSLLSWIQDAVAMGRNPVENGIGWLR
jgi:predicted nuclease of predicted toxin-antitoxin system